MQYNLPGKYIDARRRQKWDVDRMTGNDRNPPTDDPALLARITGGDEEALRQLYAAYRLRLWRYIWQQVGGEADLVEDVLQDVFLAIWHGAGAFRHQASVSTWIFRIAHNIGANAGRSRSHRLLGAPLVETPPPVTSASVGTYESPEEQVVERLALTEAIVRLPLKHRQVLELIFYQGFTCEEAGHILEVPTGTIKSRLSYARKTLAGYLSADNAQSTADISKDTLLHSASVEAEEVSYDA
jgi:RNA polymerase sigma-70 factor, ECF subfamily